MAFDRGYNGLLNASRAVQIPVAETDSEIINCAGFVLASITIPMFFTGTSISFLTCDTEGGTYTPLYDETNSLVSIPVTPGRVYALEPRKFQGVKFLKIISSDAEAANRILGCGMRGTNQLFTIPKSRVPVGAPPLYSDLIMWIEANQGVFQDLERTIPATMTGDPVLGWKDFSSANNNWENDNNFGNQLSNPSLILNAQNGQPSVSINKGSFLFSDLNLDAYTCFVIAKPDSTVDQVVLLLTSGNNQPAPPENYFAMPDASSSGQPGFYVTENNAVFNSSPFADTTVFNMVGTALDGVGTAHMYVNGVDTAQSGATGCTFNSFSGWPPTNGTFIGQLCAVLIYNKFLSDVDRGKVQDYLNAKYAIF